MDLYYYTSTDTMRYVLTQGDIFATNIRYMNDSEEYINGLREVYQLSQKESFLEAWIKEKGYDESLLKGMQTIFSKKNFEENKRNMEYYSISFCKENDLLSQWAIYAKESGVSIKMNFADEKYKFFTKGIDNGTKAAWELSPQEVKYFTYDSMKDNENTYKSVAYEILDWLYKEMPYNQERKKEDWRYISTLVKRYDFYQEKECRLVFDPNNTVAPPLIQYRHDKNVLKPYLDIECDFGWPIWEIMIGPGFNQSVVYDSVEHFLNHAEVKVGIKSVEDYAQRIRQHLAPYELSLGRCKEYNVLREKLAQNDWIDNVDMEEARIIFNQNLRAISRTVDVDAVYDSNVKQYFREHRFTSSGVVLTKSSIPYIF